MHRADMWATVHGDAESDTTEQLSLHFTRFVIVFLPRSKHLLISCLQSLYTVILELPTPSKIVTASSFSPSIHHEVIGPEP